MPASKVLSLINGIVTLVTSVVTSAGAADDGKIPALDAQGKLDLSVMPTGIGADSVSVVFSEAVAAGDFVNLYNNAGTLNARKADASVQTKAANGFVKAAVASAATGVVFKEGTNDQLSGKTPGARQYLSATTAGAPTETPVSGTGKTHQFLGVAQSATAMDFEADDPILLNS
jgi:hypothetical protein